jgi:uncharacterized OsmC-like protein
MELLLMGVAGCSSIDIVAILNKQKINPKVLKNGSARDTVMKMKCPLYSIK